MTTTPSIDFDEVISWVNSLTDDEAQAYFEEWFPDPDVRAQLLALIVAGLEASA